MDVFAAVRNVHKRVKGSYAVIALIAGHGVLAFRDPFGIRPLCLGRNGDTLMLASESVTLEGTGHQFENATSNPAKPCSSTCKARCTRSSAPTSRCCRRAFLSLCTWPGPDSVMDGISVYQARLNLGETLAKRVISTVPPNEIDVVIPIPESSRPSAAQLAQLLGLPYREGFVKNRYVGRTFIMPGQAVRKKSVRQKLNVIASEFKGRNVLLVDDSIVRGTTSKEIVQMARDAGAKQGLPRQRRAAGALSQCLRHRHADPAANWWRTTAPSKRSANIIGCDQLIYQDVDGMKKAIGALNKRIADFDASCFDGVYVTGDITSPTSSASTKTAWAVTRTRKTHLAPGLAQPRRMKTRAMSTKPLASRTASRDAGRPHGGGPQPVRRKLRGPVPHQRLCAARRRHVGRALCQRGGRLHLRPHLQPHRHQLRAAPGRAGRQPRPASPRPAACRPSC